MANKRALLGGQSVKVENRSGFDKSRLNILTTKVGTITPLVKQLLLPGDFSLKLNLNAELPPLATNAYLRSHLKVEAFTVPMRLCYGGFESWFCGKEIWDSASNSFVRAKLPNYFYDYSLDKYSNGDPDAGSYVDMDGSPGGLLDFFGVRLNLSDRSDEYGLPSSSINYYDDNPYVLEVGDTDIETKGLRLNIFPFVSYALIYDHWYRNKLIQRPLFAPIDSFDSSSRENYRVAHLPFSSFRSIRQVQSFYKYATLPANNFNVSSVLISDELLDGSRLGELRQRNYGDDYFTTAKPSAQEGNPIVVNTAGNQFTISALRMQNALQEFAEVNQLASPDFVQTNKARYGVAPSSGVAQKPVLVGSADFPFYTRGIANQYGNDSTPGSGNPWINDGVIGAEAGRASAQGREFVCKGSVNEPSYLMVLVTFVPEANYGQGISHDMEIFTQEGSLVDLPVGLLEHVGNEPIMSREINPSTQIGTDVFGYNQRYLWHKAGQVNEVHGLFRAGMDLQAFIPQRVFSVNQLSPQISSDFLKIGVNDLDNVTAVSGDLSEYGIMIDSAIELFVSEPLSESVLPALANPAVEHGRSVYLKSGGNL